MEPVAILDVPMNRTNLVYVAGNLGSGKSTLAQALSSRSRVGMRAIGNGADRTIACETGSLQIAEATRSSKDRAGRRTLMSYDGRHETMDFGLRPNQGI